MNADITGKIDPVKKISPLSWLLAAVMVVLLAFIFRTPIEWMIDRWLRTGSYYSHGFFVPAVALFFVWRDRWSLAALKPQSSLIGLFVLLTGLLVLTVSGWLSVFFSGAFAMILVIWGLVGFLLGRRVMARLIFPMFLLLFMVPPPLQMISNISLKMKLLATQIALLFIDWVGVLATNDGPTIFLESGANVTVGDACSGLRSLISLIFLGVLFAYLSDLTLPRKGLLFLSSIPIAIIANVVRIMALCLIANTWGEQAILGIVHDMSGYLIFVVAFLLLYGASRVLGIGLPSAKVAAESLPPDEAPIVENPSHGGGPHA